MDTTLPTRPPSNIDTLSISNLHLDTGILAPYIFGDRKQQPATVSITLELEHGFRSAASTDALDQNTVHYGNLAKAIRDARPDRQTLRDLVEWAEAAVQGLARREDGTSRVRRCEVRVWLPKASVAGVGVEVGRVKKGKDERVVSWGVRGVRVMALIGVNSIERTAKQALDVDLEVWDGGDEGVLERDVHAFGLEEEMIRIIEPTSFETLESLGEHVVENLRPRIQRAIPSCSAMRLTMSKPKAIAFADAPVLSLTRTLSHDDDGGRQGTAGKRDFAPLRLFKPYV